MYKILPSQILGLEDKYEAFCFNEAVMYIQSFRYIDYEDNGKLKWSKTPHWIDEEKPQSNSELVKMIQKQNMRRK